MPAAIGPERRRFPQLMAEAPPDRELDGLLHGWMPPARRAPCSQSTARRCRAARATDRRRRGCRGFPVPSIRGRGIRLRIVDAQPESDYHHRNEERLGGERLLLVSLSWRCGCRDVSTRHRVRDSREAINPRTPQNGREGSRSSSTSRRTSAEKPDNGDSFGSSTTDVQSR